MPKRKNSAAVALGRPGGKAAAGAGVKKLRRDDGRSAQCASAQGCAGEVGEGEESEMKAKVHVTVDTATLSRPSVERLLRQHQFLYDIVGTEPAQGDEIEASGGQSLYSLPLPDRATEAETAFVREVLDTVRLVQHPHLRAARFFYAHVLAGRAVFVTANDALFGTPRSVERNRLAALAKTRIMSFAEFERWCSEPR